MTYLLAMQLFYCAICVTRFPQPAKLIDNEARQSFYHSIKQVFLSRFFKPLKKNTAIVKKNYHRYENTPRQATLTQPAYCRKKKSCHQRRQLFTFHSSPKSAYIASLLQQESDGYTMLHRNRFTIQKCRFPSRHTTYKTQCFGIKQRV